MERSATLRGQTLDDGPRSHSHNATPPRIFASLDEPRERASIARSVFAGIPEKTKARRSGLTLGRGLSASNEDRFCGLSQD